MSNELDSLERDISRTRARLAANLSVMTSGTTLDELKTALKSEALEAGDDLMDRAKASGLAMVRHGLDDLKNKAMENPVAVVAIGAGIGWQLWKRPPIASALLGYGLFSLLRGSARDPLQNAARDAGDRLGETASAVVGTASRTARDLRDKAVSMAERVHGEAAAHLADVQDKASSVTADMRETAAALACDARGTVSSLVGEATELAGDAWSKSQRSGQALFEDVADRTRHWRADPQSQVLLSIAGVAVAAAVGVAVSRYRSGPQG